MTQRASRHCCYTSRYGERRNDKTRLQKAGGFFGRSFFAEFRHLVAATAAAAAAADFVYERAERTVFAHTICKGGEHGPTAAGKGTRREYVSARAENEQDNENPKIVIAL